MLVSLVIGLPLSEKFIGPCPWPPPVWQSVVPVGKSFAKGNDISQSPRVLDSYPSPSPSSLPVVPNMQTNQPKLYIKLESGEDPQSLED